MKRRTFFGLTGACVALAGCINEDDNGGDNGSNDDGNNNGDSDNVDPGPESFWLLDNNNPDHGWWAWVAFVSQPFSGASVRDTDGELTSYDVTTIDELVESIDETRPVSVEFEDGDAESREYDVGPRESYEDVFPAVKGGGALAITARDDGQHRRVHGFSCLEQDSRIRRFNVEVSGDGSEQTAFGECAE